MHGMVCVAAGWLESKHVNNSTVTATDNDYDALRHYNIQDMVTKHKRVVNPTAQLPRDTLWVILMSAVL